MLTTAMAMMSIIVLTWTVPMTTIRVTVNNGLSNAIPDEIQGLDVLDTFYLGFVLLTGTLPLDALANTMIAKQPDRFADQLGTDHYLQFLQVENTTLTGTLSSTIGNFPSLIMVWLFGNLFSGTIPSTIGLMASLDIFMCTHTFSGTIPPEIYNVSSLGLFIVQFGELTGTIPEPPTTFPSLQYLRLGDNLLSGNLPNQMDKFPSLVSLDVFDNLMSGEIPSSVGDLENLRNLNLFDNMFTGKLMEDSSFLYNLTAIETLGLGENFLSGTISTAIGLLTKLTLFTCSHQSSPSATTDDQERQLTGTIPTEIGQLTSLQIIQISGNQLTGSIPTEIASIGERLNVLDVSRNELSGTFPTELGLLSAIGM